MSSSESEPLILYVPGLLPKPEAGIHRDALLRCLLEGMRRVDPEMANDFEARQHCFDIVSWTYDFYGEHRDFDIDRPAIDRLLAQTEPTERDVAEAVSWQRRLLRSVYKAGDLLPFLIPRLANEKLEVHLRDLRRYTRNNRDIAEHTRRLLKVPLESAAAAGRPILLIGHSMGSVIAFDALWQLSRREHKPVFIDLFMTMGSPLGQRFIQDRLLGAKDLGERRYPANIDRWINIAAVGELTALDRDLKNDFQPMLDYGLLTEIIDHEIFTWYRLKGALNVHAEYGYLVNEVTARVLRDWWRDYR
ncbi:MAG: hypothetical protein OEX13_11395 [Gammaproteobacteria bacterium]|nr:hypothetical protein [Gammaproteobacteria bacterium]